MVVMVLDVSNRGSSVGRRLKVTIYLGGEGGDGGGTSNGGCGGAAGGGGWW